MNRRPISYASATLAALTLTSVALAGPINPPAGPIVPTNKTLQEIFDKAGTAEPRTAINATNTPGDADSTFKIVNPGSYYLTGNITGVVGKHGIEIAASGVTIDLNGFELAGVPAMGAFDGINASVLSLSNISIRNGTVRNWGADGIDLAAAFSTRSRVEAVRASANAGIGIALFDASTISDCNAAQNTGHGASVGTHCTLTSCTSTGNSGAGFTTLVGPILVDCLASGNTLSGFDANAGASLSRCTARSNTAGGFVVGTGANFIGCLADANTGGNGFTMSVGCTLHGCTATNNTSAAAASAGFSTTGGSVFIGCVAYFQTSTAAGTGTTGAGFVLGTSTTIKDCVAAGNKGDNIRAEDRCLILNNTSQEAGFVGNGAAIHATGVDNRIEGNNCVISDRGIDIDGAGNIVLRNTCSGNTSNWEIAANNVYGPILDRTVPASAAVAAGANAAASTLATTDPNANFSY